MDTTYPQPVRLVAQRALANMEGLSPLERATLLEGLAHILDGEDARLAQQGAKAIRLAEAHQHELSNHLRF